MKYKIKEALEDYTKSADRIAQLWCIKHGFDRCDTYWVADEVGGMFCAANYFADMQTMIDDLKYNAPKEDFLKWHDYCIDIHGTDVTAPNFWSWIKGCPRATDEELKVLKI